MLRVHTWYENIYNTSGKYLGAVFQTYIFIQWIKFILNFWLSTHLFSNSYLIILLLPGHHPQTLPGTLASQGPKWNLPARGAEVGPGSHAL